MQLFTVDMIMEMMTQIEETSALLFESIITVAWSSILDSLSALAPSTLSGDWSSLAVRILMAISGTILLYRLIKNNLLDTIEFILTR